MIAFDAATPGLDGAATSLTWSHTCSTGANRILFVGAFGNTTDVVTGCTYGGVAMTLIGKIQVPADRWLYLWCLVAPATGANNVVVSASSSVLISAASSSYTGASQTGQPDASTTNSATTGTSLATSVTTVADQCWTFLVFRSRGASAPTAGAGTTVRAAGQLADGLLIGDSNGIVSPPASHSMTGQDVNSSDMAAIMASFSPAAGASSSGALLALL